MLKTDQDCRTCRAIGYGITVFIVGILFVGMFESLNPLLSVLGAIALGWIGTTLVHGFCVLAPPVPDTRTSPALPGSSPVAAPSSVPATDTAQQSPTDVPELVRASTAPPAAASVPRAAEHWSMTVPQSSPLSAQTPAGGSGSRGIVMSAGLPGEADLRGSVGSWRYVAPAVAVHGRPVPLTAPRGGAADDLTVIKGVGPKLEALLHRLGIFHFDQIANWTETEIAWVDDNLEGFKGRVTRDHWVAQAAILAAGGKPEDIR